MVAGVVSPPALDITNEELIRSHLHAVWIAQAKLALPPKIADILDLTKEQQPLREEIAQVIRQSTLMRDVQVPMRRVLDQILNCIGTKTPVWLKDADLFVESVAKLAPENFDNAFNRWRDLYGAARLQLRQANQNSEMPGISTNKRDQIKMVQIQAQNQIAILEQGENTSSSDFYSYRYLATEGFLPGYNFPRLPLYAYIPGESKSGNFIQRARFLAISEFGPRSLIYHEGRAYRVVRAKLTPEMSIRGESALATKDIFICNNCGACHDAEVNLCHACHEPMTSQGIVKATLRIDNVEAVPAERITANDEERVRQGFDIQTVFTWPSRKGKIQVLKAQAHCDKKLILDLQYANSAEIIRINKGLKRRVEQTVLGFNINPSTGYWTRSDDENDIEYGKILPDATKSVRIVPIVRDRKNALLLRFSSALAYTPKVIATVQHALLRGIEVVFQLEEGEICGEPLPNRNDRRCILYYEATEGGAGALSRLLEEPSILNKVACEALSLMHFNGVNEAINIGDARLLVSRQDASCVRGCYHCLLSYFNQTDHELIDREDLKVKKLLIDLARCKVTLASEHITNNDATGWIDVLMQAGLPAPDSEPLIFSDQKMSFVWRTHRVAASTYIPSKATQRAAHTKGWSLFTLPDVPQAGAPPEMISLFRI
jgi:uncharacterized protein YihD (DUF1040 family)